MSYHMSIEELKKLKRGDYVCVGGVEAKIISKGPKWIHLKNIHQPINMSTGRLRANNFGHQNELPVYRTRDLFNLAADKIQRAQKVRNTLRDLTQFGSQIKPELVEDLHAVLTKHNLV